MEQILYERPRERLRDQGAPALTLVELLQIIVSPGNAQLSSAKLARYILSLISSEGVAYRDLAKVPGVGHAKACQILALLELIARVRRE